MEAIKATDISETNIQMTLHSHNEHRLNHSRLCKLPAKKKNKANADKAHFLAGLENVSAEPTRSQQLEKSI